MDGPIPNQRASFGPSDSAIPGFATSMSSTSTEPGGENNGEKPMQHLGKNLENMSLTLLWIAKIGTFA